MSNYKHPLRWRWRPGRLRQNGAAGSVMQTMRSSYQLAVVTNDIYTKEDQRILTEAGALEPDRIVGGKPAAARIPPSAKMRR